MAHDFTVQRLREKIASECEDVGIREPDPLPVEVWTQAGGREFEILDVIFDDGVISIEVREV
jgi:hypothetical protein